MKIISWNVNGLRACAERFLGWLESSDADIVALQETRSLPEQLTGDVREPPGWFMALNPAEKKGYSGARALYTSGSRYHRDVSLGEARFDLEGRLQLARFDDLLIANVYFPNGSGKNRDNSRIPYKLDFYQRLFEVLEPERSSGKPVVVVGDFNTAHRPIDLARPKSNEKTSGFRPEERDELERWLASGWVDSYRHVHGDQEGVYTWWAQRGRCRERNVGWRIDYALLSPGALKGLREAFVLPDVMGSDHCPVGVTLDPTGGVEAPEDVCLCHCVVLESRTFFEAATRGIEAL